MIGRLKKLGFGSTIVFPLAMQERSNVSVMIAKAPCL